MHNYYVDNSVLRIETLTAECGYVYISWTITDDENICAKQFIADFSTPGSGYTVGTEQKFLNYSLPGDTLFNVTVYGINPDAFIASESTAITTIDYGYIKTVPIYRK